MKRAFSFGGGRQSTAALVLAARGQLEVDLFVFANVGNDSENPDTLEYVETYAKPYAVAHGDELVEVQRRFRDGRDPSLYHPVPLPEPPKSSCWFCPFHDLPAWGRLRLHRPDLFQASVELEQLLNERRASLGRDVLYLTNRLKPLAVAVPEGADQLELFDEGGGACTSGYCWT